MQRLDTRETVARLAASIEKGRGVMPFVGSGLSVESGIPTGSGLLPYLEHVMRRCREEGYDLAATGWPPLTDADWQHRPATMSAVADRAAGARPSRSIYPAAAESAQLEQELAHASGRWNDLLVLLSRIKRRVDRQIWLSQPDSKIIDSFGRLLTRNTRPNFGHAMLAQLARSARIRMVLTTNFDDLLEDAFRRVRLELDVYDVSVHGSLPDYRMVATQPALIKLHGSRVGIRADQTLNYAPDRADVYAFVAYLTGSHFDPDPTLFHWSSLRAAGSKRSAPDTRAHRRLHHRLSMSQDLLVLGFGGRDLRVMQLIVQALNVVMSQAELPQFASTPNVFWICHDHSDLANLSRTLDDLGASQRIQECFQVTVEDAQVLLHELYATLTGTVPSRGLDYEFLRDIAPEPRAHISEQRIQQWLEELSGGTFPAPGVPAEGPAQRGRRLLVARSADRGAGAMTSSRGVSSLAAAHYWQLSGQPRPYQGSAASPPSGGKPNGRCVWLEPSVFASPGSLLRGLLTRIAARNGGCETGLLSIDGAPEALARACIRFHVAPREWTLFVYARDGGGGLDLSWSDGGAPDEAGGTSSPAPGIHFQKSPNPPTTWSKADWQKLDVHLAALESAGFQVVYMPFDAQRRAFFQARIPWLQAGDPHTFPGDPLEDAAQAALEPGAAPRLPDAPAESTPSQRNVLEHALHWALDTTDRPRSAAFLSEDAWRLRKLRFLHTLCLCRQFQCRFVLLSNAAVQCAAPFNARGWDNDVFRVEFVARALGELREMGLLRNRPGGFVWMHRDVRLALLAILAGEEWRWQAMPDRTRAALYGNLRARIEQTCPKFDACGHRARTHVLIAEAFEAASRSTSGHWLVLEELYHLNQALLHAHVLPRRAPGSEPADACSSALMAERVLLRVLRILRSSRAVLERGVDPELASALFPGEPPVMVKATCQPACPQDRRLLGLYAEYRREWTLLRSQLRIGSPAIGNDDASAWERDEPGVSERLRELAQLEIDCFMTRSLRKLRKYAEVENALESIIEKALGPADEHAIAARLRALKGATHSFVQHRRELFAAINAWLYALPSGELRRRSIVVAIRTFRELVWVWTDQLEDQLLFCWRGRATATQTHSRRPAPKHSYIEELEPPQHQQWAVAAIDWDDVGQKIEACRPHALRICVLANVIQELSSFLDVEAHLDEDQRVIGVRTYYAHALGYLGRFREAHCHLNDAFGRLNRSRFSSQRQYWAFLELRRGAIYLLEAQFSFIEANRKKKGRHRRKARAILATLDDAWLAFTRARNHLLGGPLAPRHWGRLFVYELRTLAMYADLESFVGCPVDGWPDRLPGGRLRRALDLLRAESVLAEDTLTRRAQVVHSAIVVLRADGGREQDPEVKHEIELLLQDWRKNAVLQSAPGADEPSLTQQLHEFALEVARMIPEPPAHTMRVPVASAALLGSTPLESTPPVEVEPNVSG